jgi:hypothetical protein
MALLRTGQPKTHRRFKARPNALIQARPQFFNLGFTNMSLIPRQRVAPRKAPSMIGWWSQISGRERISIVSIVAGAVIVIVNAISWPIALCYIQRQQTLARLAEDSLSAEAAEAAALAVTEASAMNGELAHRQGPPPARQHSS